MPIAAHRVGELAIRLRAFGVGVEIEHSRMLFECCAIFQKRATELRCGSKGHRARLIAMATSPYLSDAEFASLAEVGTGFCHAPIPLDHAKHLLELRLAYNFLGSLRITAVGRQMLRAARQETKQASQNITPHH